MSIRTVRDKDRVLRFDGDQLASATSQRAGAVRWSELVVYQLASKRYVVSKVGRSSIAHRPDCTRITKEMPTWLEAGEEARVRREPCIECQPEVGNAMDPQTVLETTRHTVLYARDPEQLWRALLGKQSRPAKIVIDVLDQLRSHDRVFDQWYRHKMG